MKTLRKTNTASYYTNNNSARAVYNNNTFNNQVPHVTVSGRTGAHTSIGTYHYSRNKGYTGRENPPRYIQDRLSLLYNKYMRLSRANIARLNLNYNRAKPKPINYSKTALMRGLSSGSDSGSGSRSRSGSNSYFKMKKGGKIPKAGLYKLHKGEVVVPASRVKTVDKALRQAGKKPLKKKCRACFMTPKQLLNRKKK